MSREKKDPNILPEGSVFRTVSEYWDFSQEHKVYGTEAVALKKKLDRETEIPIPKVKRSSKNDRV